ncbi:MAG: hypothetical protein KDK36_19380, partial [Leptospiraceae bacterium]|nr:hypothetical protein [Leptospiraceae bacterium]
MRKIKLLLTAFFCLKTYILFFILFFNACWANPIITDFGNTNQDSNSENYLWIALFAAFNQNTNISYSIGGSISGLTSAGLVLQNNSSDDLSVSQGASDFTFSTSVTIGDSYSITVKTQPINLECSITDGSGIISSANVTNVNINCINLTDPANWSYVQSTLLAQASLGSYGSETATEISVANLPTNSKWFGGVLAPNGKIYGIPRSSNDIIVIDPSSDSATIITPSPSLSGNWKWAGGTLAPNGKIYGTPNYATSVIVIDPSTDSVSTFGSLSNDSNKWRGGILGANGKIYAGPSSGTSILIIDPSTDTTSSIESITTGLGRGVLAPNGKIYFHHNATGYILDTSTNSISTFNTVSGSWVSPVLAPNGKIYCIPNNETSVLVIDPSDNSVYTIGSVSSDSNKWYGGVLAPNGKIYGIPRDATNVLVIDTNNDIVSTLGSLSSTVGKWLGGVLAPNGKIYGIPEQSTNILVIDTKS